MYIWYIEMNSLETITNIIVQAGGHPYIVGGTSITILSGSETKDVDIEVFNILPNELESKLNEHNIKYTLCGKFSTYKITFDNDDVIYEIAFPRRESRIGLSHNEFNILIDKNLSIFEAAKRRDLTINAIYYDLISKQFIDPFNGILDYYNGILKHIDDNTFIEDPLRVLRIMQLLPRKAKKVHPDTIQLCRNMFYNKEHLNISKERIFQEFNKMLLSKKPSEGLKFLRESEWIGLFPELQQLIGVPQNTTYHPEGDVWEHTLLVVDAMSTMSKDLDLLYAALLHDIGKPSVINKYTFATPGHEDIGAIIAFDFITNLSNNKKLSINVQNLVKYHMRPLMLFGNKSSNTAWKKLYNLIDLQKLGILSYADCMGKYDEKRATDIYNYCISKHNQFFQTYKDNKIPKLVTGKLLLSLGYKEGKLMGEIIDKCYKLQLNSTITDPLELLKIIEN